MASNKRFTAVEWYDFLVNEVQLPEEAKDEIEKLAQKLAHEYMSKDDFVKLSEDELKSTFEFQRQGLLNQITRWKNSSSNVTTIDSRSNNTNQSSPALQQNPLLGIIEMLKTPINQTHITAAQSLLTTDTTTVSQGIPNYLSAIDTIETLGSHTVPESERVYYRCRSCDKCVWVAKEMSALTEFPACFECQKQWLSGLLGFLK